VFAVALRARRFRQDSGQALLFPGTAGLRYASSLEAAVADLRAAGEIP